MSPPSGRFCKCSITVVFVGRILPAQSAKIIGHPMRLWSLHPSLLDRAGLVALWREALLAQKVLLGATKGYRHHPQLDRFRKCSDPLLAIASYLWSVADEAKERGYQFDTSKIATRCGRVNIPVTNGQLAYELTHLKQKLRQRDPKRLRKLISERVLAKANPTFESEEGPKASWERTPRNIRANPLVRLTGKLPR